MVQAPEDEPILSGLSSKNNETTINILKDQIQKNSQFRKPRPSFLLTSLLMMDTPKNRLSKMQQENHKTAGINVVEQYHKVQSHVSNISKKPTI